MVQKIDNLFLDWDLNCEIDENIKEFDIFK